MQQAQDPSKLEGHMLHHLMTCVEPELGSQRQLFRDRCFGRRYLHYKGLCEAELWDNAEAWFQHPRFLVFPSSRLPSAMDPSSIGWLNPVGTRPSSRHYVFRSLSVRYGCQVYWLVESRWHPSVITPSRLSESFHPLCVPVLLVG